MRSIRISFRRYGSGQPLASEAAQFSRIDASHQTGWFISLTCNYLVEHREAAAREFAARAYCRFRPGIENADPILAVLFCTKLFTEHADLTPSSKGGSHAISEILNEVCFK